MLVVLLEEVYLCEETDECNPEIAAGEEHAGEDVFQQIAEDYVRALLFGKAQ